MEPFMDRFLKMYDKEDHHTHGIIKLSLDEVCNALGYWQGYDSNLRPYQRTIHELTNQYILENRDFITAQTGDDRITYNCNTRFDTKHAILLIALLCGKHRNRN